MNWGKKKPNDIPVLRVKTTRSWESFSIGLIIGKVKGEFDATWVNVK